MTNLIRREIAAHMAQLSAHGLTRPETERLEAKVRKLTKQLGQFEAEEGSDSEFLDWEIGVALDSGLPSNYRQGE